MAETEAHVDTRFDVLRRFCLAVLQDALLLDGIPDATNLDLLPEELPEFSERERAIGETYAAKGDLVTFRPVRLADFLA